MARQEGLQVMLKPLFGSEQLVPLLCDSEGNVLPNQHSMTIEVAVDDIAVVTVRFVGVGFAL